MPAGRVPRCISVLAVRGERRRDGEVAGRLRRATERIGGVARGDRKAAASLTTFQVSLICQARASAAFVRTVNAIAKRAPGANMRVPLLPGVSASTASPARGCGERRRRAGRILICAPRAYRCPATVATAAGFAPGRPFDARPHRHTSSAC